MNVPDLATLQIVRNINMTRYLESLLWSAVATVLVIRAFLASTGYPQLGGGGLHIAHMLWGGLLMLVALVLTLALLGHDSKRVAAIIGGIGFGTFIDELGKFITSDNGAIAGFQSFMGYQSDKDATVIVLTNLVIAPDGTLPADTLAAIIRDHIQ